MDLVTSGPPTSLVMLYTGNTATVYMGLRGLGGRTGGAAAQAVRDKTRTKRNNKKFFLINPFLENLFCYGAFIIFGCSQPWDLVYATVCLTAFLKASSMAATPVEIAIVATLFQVE